MEGAGGDEVNARYGGASDGQGLGVGGVGCGGACTKKFLGGIMEIVVWGEEKAE